MSLARVPRFLLHLEGGVLLAASLWLYLDSDYSVLALVLLFLAPDVALLAYVAGPRAGCVAYNAVHTLGVPVVLGAVGVVADADVAVQLALIWLAHIGIDRALGYGLKYPSGFRDTHLQRV